jgi:hypothetical protein
MPMTKSKSISINGKEIELFYINTLAERLGRISQTIRKWEISGVIPKAMFRDGSGKRMYSEAEISIIERIAEECKIKQGLPIAHTSFSAKVARALEEFRDKNYRGGK